MEEPELEPELSLATSVLPQLVGGLQAPGAADRAEALGQLAQIVDTSFGEDALVLGEYLRMSGGIDALVALLEDEEPMLHQTALLLIGNLASDAVDPNSVLTKGVLKEVGCFELLLPHLFSEDWLTLVYALGAVQNTCADAEHVGHLQQAGALPRLAALSKMGDAQIESYAQGCLANARPHLRRGLPQAAGRSPAAKSGGGGAGSASADAPGAATPTKTPAKRPGALKRADTVLTLTPKLHTPEGAAGTARSRLT